MADFGGGGTGAGFARGIRSVRERKLAEKTLKQEQQQADAKQLAESIKDSESQTLERSKLILEEIGKAIEGGANEEEQLQPFAQAFKANLDTHAAFLEEIRVSGESTGADMSALTRGQQFIDQNLPVLEATLQAAEFQNKDFETVSAEEVAEVERVSGAKFPEGALLQRGPDNKIVLSFDPTENPSTIQERRDLLLASGLDKPMGELSAEEIANGIAGGRFGFGVNPITKEMFVEDMTGQEIAREPIEAPSAETPIIPPDIKTGAATGVGGIVKNVANTLRDAFGLGLQDPEAQDATDALITIQTLTSLHLLQEISGRDTDGLRKRLDRLTVTANSFFQGEERSKNRLEDTQQMLQGEIDRMKTQLATEIDPETRVKLQNNLPQIERLRDAYGSLLAGFDTEEEERDPEIYGPGGILDQLVPEGEQNEPTQE